MTQEKLWIFFKIQSGNKNATELENRFEILENREDEDNIDNKIHEKWENIKTIIKETKQQLIEKDESTET